MHYPTMNSIPTYALYGEAETEREHEWLHWETIQSRSRLHEYRIAPHRHEQFFQVLHLTGGWAGVRIDDQQFDLRHQGVVVVPALSVHSYAFSDNVEGVVLTLLERDILATGIEKPPAGVISAESFAVGEAIDRLIEEADRPGGRHDVAMRALIMLLVVALHRARSQPVVEGHRANRAQLHAKAFRFLVDKKFRDTRRIADYAAELAISPTHLNRICRDVLGASALEVIERRIALEARRQLLFSTLTIKEIGAELGYEDPAYFTRFVTRMLGEPPGRFREKMRVE